MNLITYHRRLARARRELRADVERINYGPSARQYLLLATPAGVPLGNVRGLAFYFHGGGWTFGRPEWFLPAARPWLDRGYAVALPSHRRPPAVGLDRIVTDCWSAVTATARAYAAATVSAPPSSHRSFSIPLAPAAAPPDTFPPADFGLHLGGISSGAHLAAVLATDPERWLTEGFAAPPRKVLLSAGPLDLSLLPTRPLRSRYAHLDPLRRLAPATENSPRWLLQHGLKDRLVPPANSRHFADRLAELGHDYELDLLPNVTHPEAGAWAFDDRLRTRIDAFLA